MNCFRQHHRPMTIAAMKTTTGKTTEEITRSATMLTGGGAEGGGSGGSIGGGATGGGNGGGTGGSAGTMPTVVADANVKSVIKEQSLMRPTLPLQLLRLGFLRYYQVQKCACVCERRQTFFGSLSCFRAIWSRWSWCSCWLSWARLDCSDVLRGAAAPSAPRSRCVRS